MAVLAPSEVALAGVGARALAILVDALVSLAAFVAVIGIVGAIRDVADGIATPAAVVGYAGVFLLPALLTTRPGRRNGQTLGKQLLGIRVHRENGRPVGPATALGREVVGKTISGLLLGLGFAAALLDPRAQALHDKMFATIVIVGDPPTEQMAPPVEVARDEPPPAAGSMYCPRCGHALTTAHGSCPNCRMETQPAGGPVSDPSLSSDARKHQRGR